MQLNLYYKRELYRLDSYRMELNSSSSFGMFRLHRSKTYIVLRGFQLIPRALNRDCRNFLFVLLCLFLFLNHLLKPTRIIRLERSDILYFGHIFGNHLFILWCLWDLIFKPIDADWRNHKNGRKGLDIPFRAFGSFPSNISIFAAEGSTSLPISLGFQLLCGGKTA